MKIQELESTIWDGTRQLAELEAFVRKVAEYSNDGWLAREAAQLVTQFDGEEAGDV